MTDQTLLIFVKAPVPGIAKTRLTPPLTPLQAAALSGAMARDTLRVAAAIPNTDICIAYEPHAELPDPDWLTEGLEWFPQEGFDLGERLQNAVGRVFARGPRSLVVIGSDLPTLSVALLEKAFGLLGAAPIVLGPTEDGGYYLIGLRQPHVSLFERIQWSKPTVLAQTVAKLQTVGLEYKFLPRRMDLDTPADLLRVRSDPAMIAVQFEQTLAALREF